NGSPGSTRGAPRSTSRVYGTQTWPPPPTASRAGTSECRPNRPTLTSSHTGSPVCASTYRPSTFPTPPPPIPSRRAPTQPSISSAAGGRVACSATGASLQELARRGGRVGLSLDDPMQQLGDLGVVRGAGLELAAQAGRRQAEHLVVQVSLAA